MDECDKRYAFTDEDLRAAVKDLKTYVDVTEEDLRKIYELALRHARERMRRTVPVGEVMVRDVVVARPDTDMRDAARMLSERRISGMPVVDEGKKVIGVISEADILASAGIGRGHTFKDLLRHLLGEPLPARKNGDRVGDVMSSPAITTTYDTDIRNAAAIIDERRIKRLPVVDAQGTLVGIISRGDIVRALGRE